MRPLNLKKVFYAGLIMAAFFSAFSAFSRSVFDPERSQDFQWSPSRLLLEKNNPFQAYLDWKQGKIEKPIKLSQAPNYPASGIVFLWPYAVLSWEKAKLGWAVSNMIFTLLIILSLQSLAPLKREFLILAAALFVLAAPWRTQIGCGQHGLFALASFIGAAAVADRSRPLAGLLLAFSWLKYTLTFPLSLYFLTRKNFPVLIICALIHTALTLFVSIYIGCPFFKLLSGPIKSGLISTGKGVLDIWGLTHTYHLPTWAAWFGAFLLFVMTGIVQLRNKEDKPELLKISFFSFISMAVFFHLSHDCVILILPLWYLLSDNPKNGLFRVLVIGLIGLQWYLTPAVLFFLSRLNPSLNSSPNALLQLPGVMLFYLLMIIMAFMKGEKIAGKE